MIPGKLYRLSGQFIKTQIFRALDEEHAVDVEEERRHPEEPLDRLKVALYQGQSEFTKLELYADEI